MGNYRHKLLVERAMKRLDERTPMDARTPDRFTQKPLSQATEEIRKKAVIAKDAVGSAYFSDRKKLVEKALAGYMYDDIVEGKDRRIEVKKLVYAELAEDGIMNDRGIVARFERVLSKKVDEVNEKIYGKYRFINTKFDRNPMTDRNGAIVGNMTIFFIDNSATFDLSNQKGQLQAVKIYNLVVEVLKTHLKMVSLAVEKVADQWDNAYRRTWAKDESIAYADLPWAEKTQTTVKEGKDSEKLFGNKKRLNEAIDRMFEDAVEIGANLKTEEEMMSK